MAEERAVLKALIGAGLAVYVLIAAIPFAHGHATPIAGSDVALPLLLLAWCALEFSEARR